MDAVLARVKNGRLVVDEPTNLPEGTEVRLLVEASDDLDASDRAALEAAFDEAEADIDAGRGVPAAELIAELRRR